MTKSLYIWIAVVTGVVGLAQACSRTDGNKKTDGPSIVHNSGNGDSYSGKAYKFKNPGGSCPTDNESVVVLDEVGNFSLARENCQNLTPYRALSPASVVHDFQNERLEFNGQAHFVEYNPACNYPEYTGPISAGGDCSAEPMLTAVVSTNPVASGSRYEFAIYNASSDTSGFGQRYITYQNVNLAASLAANSVDIVVSSYEPVRWQFIGNTAAIRSVHIRGYHCAVYTGVSAAKVSLSTYEQGSSPNVKTLPISTLLGGSASSYEGTCQAQRTFQVQ